MFHVTHVSLCGVKLFKENITLLFFVLCVFDTIRQLIVASAFWTEPNWRETGVSQAKMEDMRKCVVNS